MLIGADFDIGPLYRKIEKDDAADQRFGYIPQMARCRLGALNSEGFCERMLSAAGDVLTEGNTLLDPAENRRWRSSPYCA